ncbi:MAG: LacI family transcriptional regulator [Actinomycetota bacterium]|nr:LacI family transcriptional regulator [Actinomycetota bacterium]
MRDVADRAGVSVKTVSRVVNNDRYISADVRGRVEEAVAALGYAVDTAARMLRSGRDTALGVAVPSLGDPFFAEIVQGIEFRARAQGMSILVTSLGETAQQERAAVEGLLLRRITGLIVAPVSEDHSYLQPWVGRVPVVFIDRPPQHLVADSVIEDDEAAAAAAVEQLVGAGHRRIAVLVPEPAAVTVQRRVRGYRSALTAAGLPLEDAFEVAVLDSDEAARAALTRLLDGAAPPTALLLASSAVATRVVPATHQLRRTDLAMISFGDFRMASSLQPSISAVDQQPSALGRAAADRVFRRLNKPEPALNRSVLLPIAFIDRESGRLPPPGAATSRNVGPGKTMRRRAV